MWTEDMFKVKKPIIAMLHLDPLPGDPMWKYDMSMDDVVEDARKDLRALQDGGVDGIIVSNEFSFPYQRNMDRNTVAAMAYVIGNLKPEIRVPLGVDAISDGVACLELAAGVGADFVRGTFSGVYVGDGGFYNNDFSQVIRRKYALHLDELKMLYFINPESDQPLDLRPLKDIARTTIAKAAPDGLCISADAAGQDVDDELIISVKEYNPEVVVLCNTGCRVDTIRRKLKYADAAVVGTTFKYDGKLENHVDVDRVREFMNEVYKIREEL